MATAAGNEKDGHGRVDSPANRETVRRTMDETNDKIFNQMKNQLKERKKQINYIKSQNMTYGRMISKIVIKGLMKANKDLNTRIERLEEEKLKAAEKKV